MPGRNRRGLTILSRPTRRNRLIDSDTSPGTMRVRVAFFVVVVLSGCAAPIDTGSLGDDWDGDPDNHWRAETLTVSYEATDGRDYGPAVRAALAYWSDEAERYTGYDVALRVADGDDPAADIHVRFVDDIRDCGTHTDAGAAGCAPVLSAPAQVDRPVDVRVEAGLSEASTVAVLKHELGHTLGLTHGDEPRSVMQPESRLTTRPKTNATDRAFPWRSETLDVHVVADVPPAQRDATDRQVAAALGYFEAGAGGAVPEAVRFRRVDSAADADVVVRVTETDDCRAESGSCGRLSGVDPDGDGALEYHDRLEVTVVGMDTPAVAWHVGRWLGVGFGLESESEYPEPLRERATYEERRSEWWEE
jgi:hypothetical protein